MNVCLSIPAWEGIKKTEGNPGHALFPAYFFSTSAALGASLRGDRSHLGAPEESLEQPCFGASSEPGDRSSSRDRCTQKMPLREHPRLHRRLPGGIPGVSRDRGGAGARRGCVLPPAGCGGTAGTPRVDERCSGGGTQPSGATWRLNNAGLLVLLFYRKKSLIEHHRSCFRKKVLEAIGANICKQ